MIPAIGVMIILLLIIVDHFTREKKKNEQTTNQPVDPEKVKRSRELIKQAQVEGRIKPPMAQADKPVKGTELAIVSIISGILALGVFSIATGIISLALALQSTRFDSTKERGTHLSKVGLLLGVLGTLYGLWWFVQIFSWLL